MKNRVKVMIALSTLAVVATAKVSYGEEFTQSTSIGEELNSGLRITDETEISTEDSKIVQSSEIFSSIEVSEATEVSSSQEEEPEDGLAQNELLGPGYYDNRMVQSRSVATEQFLAKIKEGAISGWKKYQILPSITAAQAALESGWGVSGLTAKANNLFGIKGRYNGQFVVMKTQEYLNNKWVWVDAEFRKYPNWSTSVEDHGTFFHANPRYANLIGVRDYKEVARLLQADGYATDPKYAEKIIATIEANDLQYWDAEVFSDEVLWKIPKGTTVNILASATTFQTGGAIGGEHKVGPQYTVSDARFTSTTKAGRAYYLTPLNKWVLEKDITTTLTNQNNTSTNLYANVSKGQSIVINANATMFCGGRTYIPAEFKTNRTFVVEEVAWSMGWVNSKDNRRAYRLQSTGNWVFEEDASTDISNAKPVYNGSIFDPLAIGDEVTIKDNAKSFYPGLGNPIDESLKQNKKYPIIACDRIELDSLSLRIYKVRGLGDKWLKEEDIERVGSVWKIPNGSKVNILSTATRFETGEIIDGQHKVGPQYTISNARFTGPNQTDSSYYLTPLNKWVLEKDLTTTLANTNNTSTNLYANVAKGQEIVIKETAVMFCGGRTYIPKEFKKDRKYIVEEVAWSMTWVNSKNNRRAYRLQNTGNWVFEEDASTATGNAKPVYNGSIFDPYGIGDVIKIPDAAKSFYPGKNNIITAAQKQKTYPIVEARRIELDSLSLRIYRVKGLGDQWLKEEDMVKVGSIPTYYGSIYKYVDMGTKVVLNQSAKAFHEGGTITNAMKNKTYTLKRCKWMPSIKSSSWRVYELAEHPNKWVLEEDIFK